MSESNLLKANFSPAGEVKPEDVAVDPKAAYLKKAKENVCGSMVFVERDVLVWDGKS